MADKGEIKGEPSWELTGAGSGLLTAVMLVLALVFSIYAARGGNSPPDVADAGNAPGYFAAALTSVRLSVLFTAIGVLLFVWFASSLWARLRLAEGIPARGATVAMAGAGVASALLLVSLTLTAASGLSTSPSQANVVSALYVAASLLTVFGGAALSLFFFGISKVILATGVLGRWLGILALIEGWLCVLALLSPFYTTGALNAATGVVARQAWLIGWIVLVVLASVAMLAWQRREAHAGAHAGPGQPAGAGVGIGGGERA